MSEKYQDPFRPFRTMNSAQKALIFGWLLCLPHHALPAASPHGYVIGWGENISGEATSLPSVIFSNGVFSSPKETHSTGCVMIANQVLTDAVAIAAYRSSSLALRRDGTVVGWGGNWRSEVLGEPTPSPGRTNGIVHFNHQILSSIVKVATGDGFGLGLKSDGTVVGWGENYWPVKLSNVLSITAGSSSAAYAVLRGGSVVSWLGGKNHPDYGQIIPYRNLSNVVAVAIGQAAHGERAVALKSNGTVALLREDSSIHKLETPPEGLSNVVAVAAGSGHTLALKQDGTVVGWGFNPVGEATGTPKSNVSSFGYYSSGQVTIAGKVLNNVVSIAANAGYSMALKKDGTVVAWGRIQNNLYPATVPDGLSNVVAIVAAEYHSLAITTNAAVAERFRR